MADVQGSYEELFTAVPEALADLLEQGDAGGSVAVCVDGAPLVGEVVRRITGRSPALAVPPPGRNEDYVAGTGTDSSAPPSGATAIRVRDGNSTARRRAQIPAAGGIGNARSVARVQPVLACGGTAGGVRLLSQAGSDRAREEQFSGTDRVLGTPVRRGLGYGLFGSNCGWDGWGGSLVLIDPEQRVVAAYAANQMREPADDTRGLEIVMSACDGLKGLRA